ncbi:MAG: IMPACT family protein [Bacilli bacterium]
MNYSIKEEIVNELVINKSRFIGVLKKIKTEKEVAIVLKALKNQYKEATHYCYAYIIDNTKRFHDDNEPSGTAGLPILEVLTKNNLNYLLCVVIRYFGGVKLGTGGLIRAYTKTTSEALKLAKIVPLIKGQVIKIKFDYPDIKVVDYILKESQITEKIFKADITYIIKVSSEAWPDIKRRLQHIKNLTIKELEKGFIT